jgi:hypothetical protein
VHVSLVNNGSSPADYNALDFQLEGSPSNVRYDAIGIDENINDTLNSGTLNPGDTVAGDLVFEVPTSDTSFGLLWQPDIFGSQYTVPIN